MKDKQPTKLVVSTKDTDVWALAQLLNDEQVAALLSSLQIQNKLKSYEL